MSIDTNFAKRMVINKYNNRPPFDLKKPIQSYDILDKIRNYPEEACRSCCRNRSTEKSIIEIARPAKPLPPDPDSDSKNSITTVIIPKIIENFKKMTPSNSCNDNRQNTSSIQTLYRNKKTCKLGKNLPKHKLMKSLLDNLDDSRTKTRRSKLSRTNCSDSDEGVKLTSEESSESSKASPETSSTYCNIPGKVNRKTSTSELVWPLKSREMLNYASERNLKKPSCHCKKFGTIQEEAVKPRFCSESFLREEPTKDIAVEPRKSRIQQQRGQIQKSHKTFVQAQVEKLDKVLKIGPPKQAPSISKKIISGSYASRVVGNKGGQAYARKDEIACGYMKIMDRVKNNCPHIPGPAIGSSSFDSENTWSDSNSESDSEIVRFPKETRTAMGQCLNEKRRSVLLSKFSIGQSSNFGPAIPSYIHQCDNVDQSDYFDDSAAYNPPITRPNHEIRYQSSSPIRARESRKSVAARKVVKVPCKKNLLCDQGELHGGPCGYTRSNHNRVIY